MNEQELFDHIIELSGRTAKGPQPPFAKLAIPLHPEDPIDYEVVRQNQKKSPWRKRFYVPN